MRKGIYRKKSQRPGLGDAVEALLKRVGITPELVSGITGKPCGCKERKDKLNKLGKCLSRMVKGE